MGIGLGRKSLAVRFYEGLEGEDERDGTWLVLYDFKGVKPSSKFWRILSGRWGYRVGVR